MTKFINRTWLRIIVINLAILCVIFGAFEVITRIAYPEYTNAYFDDDTSWGRPIHRNRIWGHRVDPDQVDSTLKRTGNEVRVLFIGDSVTFGYGVDFADSYHEVAARTLDESGCAAVIHGTGQYHTNLEQLMRSNLRDFILNEFGANIIIYQFNVNDLDVFNPPKKTAEDSLTWRERFEKVRLTYLNRSAFLKFIQSWSMRSLQRHHPQKLQDSLRYSALSDPRAYAAAWKSFEKTLIDLNDTLHKRDIGFAILLVPESFQISGLTIDNDLNFDVSGIAQWPNDRVIDIGRRHNITVFDPLPALREFRGRYPDTRLYFPNDPNHPNRQGHAVIGSAVAQFLRGALGICAPVSGVPASDTGAASGFR